LSADAESDARDLAPHCAGLEAAEVSGLVYSDDHEQLAQELPVFDALYAYSQEKVVQEQRKFGS
jgi:hypothetical protein